VWALLGVGTMTIMISVLQEAYDSRYKHALHVGAFDKAVKRYRQKADHAKPAGRRHRHVHIHGPGGPPSTSHSSLHTPFGSATPQPQTPIEPSEATVAELQTQALECLEALPEHVFHGVKIIHQYIRFFIDGWHHEQEGEVNDRLKKLLGEIAGMGGIGKVTKDELLHDEASRHILFMLSIEKALHKLIDVAEDAVEAVQERDALVAELQRRLAEEDQGIREVEDASPAESIYAAEGGSVQQF